MSLIFATPCRRRAQIERAYALMPARIRTVPVTLHEVPLREVPHGRRGIYLSQDRSIWLTPRASIQDWLHELGHHYHVSVLGPAEHAAWQRFWEEHQDRMRDYARTNAAEAFAEAWVAIYYQPRLFARVIRRFRGIRLDPVVRSMVESFR